MDVSLDLDQFLDTFFQEASENIASLESNLLAIDANPGDRETMNAAFRAAHSLKGGAGLFGMAEIARFTHALETVLDAVRAGDMAWSKRIADLLLRSVDVLRELVHPDTPPLSEAGEELRKELLGMMDAGAHEPAASPEPPPEAAPAEAAPSSRATPRYAVHFRPSRGLLERGQDPLLVLRDLASVAQLVEVTLDSSELPLLDTIDPSACYLGWDLVVECAEGESVIREVFDFVEGYAEIRVARIEETVLEPASEEAPPPSCDAIAPPPSEPHEPPLPGIHLPPKDMPAPVIQMAPIGPVTSTRTFGMSGPPSGMRGTVAPPGGEQSTVRIATKKLDRILDLVGEVVIAKAMVGQAVRDHLTNPAVREALVTLERHTRELQEGVMSVRMVPIAALFGRFHRIVREVSTALGKEVGLTLEGVETEIDKAMVEQLVDPLTHLVRNAMDHGIEPPAERVASGKPANGTVELRASQRGGAIVIEIRDDGRGLSLDKVRAKAIERGLLAPDAEPTVEQLHMLVFEAGFSTAATVSDLSGRGVGMDVVKRNVESLGGTLSFTSEPGRGSLIRLQLPLTMAIIDGLMLRVATSTFVVPLLSVVESFRPTPAQLSTVLGRGRVIQFRGAPIPLLALGDVLGMAGACDDPTQGIVVVVESGDAAVGLLVDELVADGQVVVKSLEANYRRIDGLSGATVMGDGRVALILDVAALVRKSRVRGEGRSSRAVDRSTEQQGLLS